MYSILFLYKTSVVAVLRGEVTIIRNIMGYICGDQTIHTKVDIYTAPIPEHRTSKIFVLVNPIADPFIYLHVRTTYIRVEKRLFRGTSYRSIRSSATSLITRFHLHILSSIFIKDNIQIKSYYYETSKNRLKTFSSLFRSLQSHLTYTNLTQLSVST